jgi:hypothetical protein
MFPTELFTVAMLGSQSRCPSTDEWVKEMWCIYYSGFKKEGISVNCYSMEEPRGHYTKWNKPGTEKQIPHVYEES